MRVFFRSLQPGDGDGLDDAQRTMAREDYAFAFHADPAKRSVFRSPGAPEAIRPRPHETTALGSLPGGPWLILLTP